MQVYSILLSVELLGNPRGCACIHLAMFSSTTQVYAVSRPWFSSILLPLYCRSLFERLATGVTDAFYEPLNGMMRGPDEFAQGVLRGGKSLAENTIFGLSDSVGKVSGSLGKGLAELSMDEDYLKRRASASAHAGCEAPRTVGEGLLRGMEDVSGGILKVCHALAQPLTIHP